MKPLAIVTVYNRLTETQRCLQSFAPYFNYLQMVVVDNGSEPQNLQWLLEYCDDTGIALIPLALNVGCPRALNHALARRQVGQAVIKIDNDVLLLSDGEWLAHLQRLEAEMHALKMPLAMVSAYYQPWEQQRVVSAAAWEGRRLHRIRPVVGHCVYHSGAFMDRVGYFDVLAPDHLYGFEDLLLSHKATALGWGMYAWEGWQIENIQRHSAIGSRETRDAHVEQLRPLYNARAALLNPQRVYTTADGVLL